MAIKTATVTARIQPEIKSQAEAILEELGIPVSVFIDMAYRQIINRNGIPFSVDLVGTIPTRENMSVNDFNDEISTGLEQAKSGLSIVSDDAFAKLRKRVK